MVMDEKRLIKKIDDRYQDSVGLLEKLVNIDSGSYTVNGVNAVAEIIAARLRNIGFATERLYSGKYADHLRAYKEGSGKVKILTLCHMDTVFDEGAAAKRPFRIDGTKAYGPGIYDMKAGSVMLIEALEALFEEGFDDFGSITCLFNSDEERGSETSEKYILEEGKKADVCLVCETGIPGGKVVIERSGGGIYNLDVYGKASHAGAEPEKGIHAIEELAHKILEMHKETDYSKGRSISVGVVRGGERSNIIPDHVFAEIDIRCRTNADGKELILRMEEIAGTQWVKGTRAELKEVMFRGPIEKTAGNIRLFELLQKAGDKIGLSVTEEYCGGASDGNYTSSIGTPTIDSLGPEGDGEHTEDEVLYIDTLIPRTKLFALFLLEIAKEYNIGLQND